MGTRDVIPRRVPIPNRDVGIPRRALQVPVVPWRDGDVDRWYVQHYPSEESVQHEAVPLLVSYIMKLILIMLVAPHTRLPRFVDISQIRTGLQHGSWNSPSPIVLNDLMNP